MANAKELATYYQETVKAEYDTLLDADGKLTPRTEALVLTGLWACTPHSARWQLDRGRQVRIVYAGPEGPELGLYKNGQLVKYEFLLERLTADEFVKAVEVFIKVARGLES